MTQDMIEKMLKHKFIKTLVLIAFVLIVSIGIISLFKGNPFVHKEKVFFVEVTKAGWIITDFYLMIICGLAAFLAESLFLYWSVYLKIFHELDKIVLSECDAKQYMELLEYTFEYAKTIKPKQFRKSILNLAQARYVDALYMNEKYEEARKYLDDEWNGKKGKIYILLKTKIGLMEAFVNEDVESYCSTFQNADKPIAQNDIFISRKEILEQKYEEALKRLQEMQLKYLYQDVVKQFLMAICYDKMHDDVNAKACMQFVAKHGNTLPQKKSAQEWLQAHSNA